MEHIDLYLYKEKTRLQTLALTMDMLELAPHLVFIFSCPNKAQWEVIGQDNYIRTYVPIATQH